MDLKPSWCITFRRMSSVVLLTFIIMNFFWILDSRAGLKNPDRTVVIGDIHGDLSVLKHILIGKKLIDKNTEEWIGGSTVVVTVGDLIDRGPQSRAVMDLMMKLENQAVQQGGAVHNLLGNHELLAVMKKNELYLNMNDPSSFRDFRQTPRQSGMDGYWNAFQGNSPYAQWFRDRKSIVKVGDSLFVHAGVDEWALSYSTEEINEMVRSWIAFEQGVAPEPSYETAWVIQGQGPLWSRRLAAKMDSAKPTENKNMLPAESFKKILKHLGVSRIFIGHSLVHNVEQSLDHPVYGEHLIMTDLGLTESDRGQVVAFEVDSHGHVQATQFDRKFGEVLRTIEQHKNHNGANLCRKILIN